MKSSTLHKDKTNGVRHLLKNENNLSYFNHIVHYRQYKLPFTKQKKYAGAK